MGCHTWGYKKLNDLTKKEFDRIKEECDKDAERELSDKRTAEELHELFKRVYKDYCRTLEQTRKFLEKERGKAEYYKANIDKNPSLIRFYNSYRFIKGCCYFDIGSLDNYIRIKNYPNRVFTKANSLIRFCYKNGWKHVYWFDNEGQLVRANNNISEAKKRIIKLFKENKGILISFG